MLMGKVVCKKKNFVDKENAKYICKKCGARVKKKEKVCKAKKIKAKNTETPITTTNSDDI